MTQPSQPLTIDINLQEIFDSLCPKCKDALVNAMAAKAGSVAIRDALRAQLDGAPPGAHER